ncbi:nucleoside-diphosphate sugar epimerase [Cellulosimicrobium sp. PMB13]|uniref:nucleoside-diphosphate sugar epimerase n=1 Tax=Cellulosimicrobium sp. PMB13 TaxID=3120158 RepID=UPI003F4B74D1
MSEGGVRSRRSDAASAAASGDVVVLGEGQVARAVRDGLGGGPAPASADGAPRPWPDHVRRVVLVLPAGEFGPARPREEPALGTRERLVGEARSVGEAARARGIEHVVAVTSAMVHGAAPGRAVVDDDEAPEPGAAGVAGDLVAAEDALREALGPVPLAVVRPAVVVGPGIDTILTRHFEAPRLLTVRGEERTWQLLHVEDLVSAVRAVLDARLEGGLTAGALRDGLPDELDAATVATVAGMRTVQLPAVTAFGAAERLHRVGVLPSPASDLAFVVYPWTVSAARLHDAGWSPAWSSAAALEVLLDQVRGRLGVAGRRFGGRDAAALGAAGAAVAVLGTAAVWRQARARR